MSRKQKPIGCYDYTATDKQWRIDGGKNGSKYNRSEKDSCERDGLKKFNKTNNDGWCGKCWCCWNKNIDPNTKQLDKNWIRPLESNPTNEIRRELLENKLNPFGPKKVLEDRVTEYKGDGLPTDGTELQDWLQSSKKEWASQRMGRGVHVLDKVAKPKRESSEYNKFIKLVTPQVKHENPSLNSTERRVLVSDLWKKHKEEKQTGGAYEYIINPKNGYQIAANSKQGQKIIQQYIGQLGGFIRSGSRMPSCDTNTELSS